jgi:hypothetical protein
MQQANGLIIALHAIDQEENKADLGKPVKIEDCINSYNTELKKDCPTPDQIQEKIIRKRAKYHREEPMIEEGQMIYRLRRYEK